MASEVAEILFLATDAAAEAIVSLTVPGRSLLSLDVNVVRKAWRNGQPGGHIQSIHPMFILHVPALHEAAVGIRAHGARDQVGQARLVINLLATDNVPEISWRSHELSPNDDGRGLVHRPCRLQ